MDILSVAGFALNAYAYVKEHVVGEEKRVGPIPELVAAEYQPIKFDSNVGVVVIPQAVTEQKISVNKLLAMEKAKVGTVGLASQDVKRSTKQKGQQKGQQKMRAGQSSHVLISKRTRKIDSGMDPNGRYYLIKKPLPEN